ncbi:hypothetical protein C8J57DRAFT_550412 [Mycena rebaudengoi]|nr:hypothetical protein C8J57DRAFT_550412 [Mycena rebaudengoi]
MPPGRGSGRGQLVPKLNRVLFSQDYFNEDDFIRPIYDKDMEYEGGEISPPSSPLAPYITGSATQSLLSRAGSEEAYAGLESSPTTLLNPSSDREESPSPRGLVKARHLTLDLDTNQAMEEIWSEYNPVHHMYLQYIQFSLGGVPNPEASGSISPRAVFRTWTQDAGTKPYWANYVLHNSYALRTVSKNFSAGRVVLLASIPHNLCISNELLKWAQMVNPIALTLPDAQMSDVVPEDSPYPPLLSPA